MYSQLYAWSNLLLAYRLAAKGKRGKQAAAQFEHRLEDNLLALQADLRTENYRPGGYISFYIHEPKRRLISAAPFRDRVLHHALCNLIEPIFERSFIANSFANRVDKGTHRALTTCQNYARRYPYVLQCDLAQFFPSIDHAILRQVLAKKMRDPHVLGLIDKILASGAGILTQDYDMTWFAGDDLMAAFRPRGLPIGNLTSQFWANCYLNSFDHFVQRRLHCPAYVRYVDDFLLFSHDKAVLIAWHDAILQYLSRLRLSLHAGAHPQPVSEGIPFLGFRVFPQRRRLKRRKGVYFARKWRGLLRQYAHGRRSSTDLTAVANGWGNHARFANTVGLRKAVLGQVVLPKKNFRLGGKAPQPPQR